MQPTSLNLAVRSDIIMNSKERHELRYRRRKARREEKKRSLAEQYGDFDKVFTFENLYAAYKGCCKGVGWKASTQRYKANVLLNVVDTLDLLKSGKFKSKGFYEFDIIERGKERHIKSVHISERVVQRCLCDYSLVPIFSNSFIYDNGACMKDKGIDFAVNRLIVHLQRHYRKYGNNGYALVFDFSKYFDSINHDKLKSIIDDSYPDKRLAAFIKRLVDDFGGEKGLGLGSQISQVSALRFPNRLDHYVKEVLHIKGYGRYMDDGYMLHHSKEHLQKCLADLREICACLGIRLNEKKTQIIKISRGITLRAKKKLYRGVVFLKRKVFLSNTGKVIVIPARKGIVKERRKLKKLKIKFDAGEREFFDIKQSYNSWRGHIKHCNAKRTLKRMDRLFYELFYKETSMEEPVITIENICQACEKGPCEQPCELWYKCLEGTIIKPEDLE
jgi:retron-type reverse transcriptase